MASIKVYAGAPFEVRTACKLLRSWIYRKPTRKGKVRVIKLNLIKPEGSEGEKTNSDLGNQGYRIKSVGERIKIEGETPTGVANGVYALWRELRCAGVKDPFTRHWAVESRPYFATRGIFVNVLPLGLSGLSADTFTVSDWLPYLERIRALGANSLVLCLYANQYYYPGIEELEPNRWRYETYKKLTRYAHKLGLKVYLFFIYNAIPPRLWWKHPKIRGPGTLGVYGATFCWNQPGKEEILKISRYIVKTFREMDGFMLMLYDAGSCTCNYCSTHLDKIALEAVDTLKGWIKEFSPKAEALLSTWLAVCWEWGTPDLRKRHFASLPKDTIIMDISRINLRWAAEAGYRTWGFIIEMDPDAGLEERIVFPRPMLEELGQIVRDWKENDRERNIGILGYRITPRTQVMNDYCFLRLAWDPELSAEQLEEEVAGFISPNKKTTARLRRAIHALEDWWRKGDSRAAAEASRLFLEVRKEATNEFLEDIGDAVTILADLADLAKGGKRLEPKKRHEIYQKMQQMRIFQGYTTDRIFERVGEIELETRLKRWIECLRDEPQWRALLDRMWKGFDKEKPTPEDFELAGRLWSKYD